MHVTYIHKNFPAQFGYIAARLIREHGFRCSFVTSMDKGDSGPIERILYKKLGAANKESHFASRSFENFTRESHAVFEALRRRPDIRPDVIVGHSGFGSTLFLRELYSCPIINFCEWFYRDAGSDADFSPALGQRRDHLGFTRRCRDAMLLADLDACTAGYTPTNWQRSQIPHEYQHKLETIFDGIDTDIWRTLSDKELGKREIAGNAIPRGKRVITYVSRGFEVTRGFDIFMQVARRICDQRDDVVFLCIGSDGVYYGGDLTRIKEKSFREHVLNKGNYDLERFIFTGKIAPLELVRALNLSDLHIYLTMPFILSWSLMNALACGCTVLVSDTAPLREVLDHGRTGLLAPYFDIELLAETALEVLDDPAEYRRTLGQNALSLIHERYSLDKVLPRMIRLYERGAATNSTLFERKRNEPSVHRHRLPLSKGLDGLRRCYCRQDPVTSSEGFVDADNGDAWLTPEQELAFADFSIETTRTILEIGAWRGQTTRQLARIFPKATIIAVDTWQGGEFREPDYPNWKRMTPGAWESFQQRLAGLQDRVIAVRQRHDDVVGDIASYGIFPDFVFYDPDYNTRSVHDTLSAIQAHYPNTPVIGHDWLWQGTQKALAKLVTQSGRQLVVQGNIWHLNPAARYIERQAPEPADRRRSVGKKSNERIVAQNGRPKLHAEPLVERKLNAPIRVLATIPHFYRSDPTRIYGSSLESRNQRLVHVQACISSLRETLGSLNYAANLSRPENTPANELTQVELQIVFCVSGADHLVEELKIPEDSYEVAQIKGHPIFLGYACHEVLRDRIGDFDYCIYLEDDLVLSDTWTLQKQVWFRQMAGESSILQPNRFELTNDQNGTRKAYIDGDLPIEKTAPYQDLTKVPTLSGQFLGLPISFVRPRNPHSGCFFLSGDQFKQWAKQPYFLDQDGSFYSPLEGAATVGIMRTFRVYKPAPVNGNFFEIRHMGDSWTEKLAKRDEEAATRLNSRPSHERRESAGATHQ